MGFTVHCIRDCAEVVELCYNCKCGYNPGPATNVALTRSATTTGHEPRPTIQFFRHIRNGVSHNDMLRFHSKTSTGHPTIRAGAAKFDRWL